MEANKILTASLLDLVFDARNKAYGAYELRRSYDKRIKFSLLITGLIVLLIVTGSLFARSGGDDPEKMLRSTEVVLQQLPPEEEVVPPPVVKLPEPEPVRTERLTPPHIVPDEEVHEPPPTQEELADAKIDVIKQDGLADQGIVTPEVLDNGAGIIEQKKITEPEIWTKVEVEASFPGGPKKWIQFLERNCNGQVAADNGAPAGSYTVVVKFVVDENGQVSDLRPMTHLGYGLEEEALNVLQKAGKMKWTPAIQNGRQVKAYRSQPITFVVE